MDLSSSCCGGGGESSLLLLSLDDLCSSFLFCDRDLLFSSGESSLRRLLDLESRRDLDLWRLERSCLRDRDPLVDVDLWSSSESSSEDEDSSLADRLFRRLSRLERCSSSR